MKSIFEIHCVDSAWVDIQYGNYSACIFGCMDKYTELKMLIFAVDSLRRIVNCITSLDGCKTLLISCFATWLIIIKAYTVINSPAQALATLLISQLFKQASF